MEQKNNVRGQNDNASSTKPITCSDMGKRYGALGGRTRAKKLSARRRKEIARMGGKASSGKPKKRKEKPS